MATIRDIAKNVNVSMTTVSRVLNKDDGMSVSAELRNRIFTEAHRLGYIPPKMRRLRVEDGITIGIADWHIVRKDRANLRISDFSDVARRFCKTPVSFVRLFFGENARVDGIIALGSFSQDEVEFLKRQSYAILFVSSNKNDYQYDRIMVDHEVGLLQMVDYYMKQRRYESVGFISGYYEKDGIVIGRTRNNAFRRILLEQGYYDERLCMVGEMSAESGYQLATRAIKEGHMPRALLAGNDEIAEGVLTALEECKLRVPEDVDVTIYKDIETLLSRFPSYTSVQMYSEFMWESAIKLILERVSGKRSEVMTLVFPSKFSCGETP